MKTIDNSSIIPKYYQLKELLKEKIIAGVWKPGEKMPTEKEVVRECECSLITVNKAFGKLVEEGYVFRERGRGTFVNQKSLWGKADEPIVLKLVGMMVPDVTKEFSRINVRGVEDYLHSRGYSLILGNHDDNTERTQNYISLLLKRHVDGIIFCPLSGENYEEKNAQILKKITNRNLPLVLIDKYLRTMDCSYVVSDNIESSRKMTENLIKAGHREIAVVMGAKCSSFDDRLTGYKKALEKYSIPFDQDAILEYDARRVDIGDIEPISHFLSKGKPFTAIYAFNSTLARGIIQALEKIGKKAPDDFVLISYDSHILPNLNKTVFTHLSQPEYKMGEKAAELLIEMIEKGNSKPKKVILKSEISYNKRSDV